MSEKNNSALFEIHFGDQVFRPTKLSQFVDWTVRERDKWQWLAQASLDYFPENVRDSVLPQYESLVEYAKMVADQGHEAYDPQGAVDGHYAGKPPSLIHSTSEVGRAIMSIREAFGLDFAALAYGIGVNQISIQWWNPAHARAVFLMANPNMIDRTAVRSASRADYARWQNEATALLTKHDTLLADKEQMVAGLSREADELAVRTYWRTARRSVQLRKSLRREGDDTIADINNVKKAYVEDMKLKASVQYWNEKKGSHADNRQDAFINLRNFGIAGGLVGLVVFWFAITFMLEASGVNVLDWMVIDPPKGRAIALSTYVVVTGALGTVLTVIFWTARALLRHYLTERRLEGDADERRVMTQTYLAPISEGAAEEGDRLVILNALFRPSPDQPSGSDDTGGDIALPALLAKLMDQRTVR